MSTPLADMKPEYAYECGWQDAIDVALRTVAKLRDEYLMPTSQQELQALNIHQTILEGLDVLKDFQSIQALLKEIENERPPTPTI